MRAEIDARGGGSLLFVARRDGEDTDHIGKYLEIGEDPFSISGIQNGWKMGSVSSLLDGLGHFLAQPQGICGDRERPSPSIRYACQYVEFASRNGRLRSALAFRLSPTSYARSR
jgi:hypothetical protein